ncbi:MAG: aminotransferase [Porticoccaceae bacterium]|nr:MAG: aminotransferase [Porticoccaceae bacterium]
MFEQLKPLPPDPILGLSAAFRADPRPRKIDLGVGVYRDEAGRTPVMRAVKEAERRLLEREESKAYIAQTGVAEFNEGMLRLVLGPSHPALAAGRAAAVMTPGGTGALRLAAELIRTANPDATLWVGDPTWANHVPVMAGAGLRLATYPYYRQGAASVSFDEMMAALQRARSGDAVLLHGCCHNPCGADLDEEQWRAVAELAERKGLLPFVDLAYQGFGRGLEEDAFGVRLLAERLPEVVVATSCSKNFGLYRERTGAALVVAQSAAAAAAAASHLAQVARTLYSMPPAHGGLLAAMVLEDPALREDWEAELAAMRSRMNRLRAELAERLAARGAPRDFSFIRRQYGMFSFLGLDAGQIARLREEFGIYVVGSSRINVAGLNEADLDYVVEAILAVLR